jgi:hypothetical protein
MVFFLELGAMRGATRIPLALLIALLTEVIFG